MTCIVGLAHEGNVWMGADSAVCAGDYIVSKADSKVFLNGQYLIGSCGSVRMSQLLRYSFKPPEPPTENLFKFMATEFINELRECFKEGGFAEIDKNRETGGEFLVGVSGKLFAIYGDYQVEETSHQYNTCGSGYRIASGSMYSTAQLDPHTRITLALSAAEFFTTTVRGPFNILSLKEELDART